VSCGHRRLPKPVIVSTARRYASPRDGEWLRIRWIERGVPLAQPPPHRKGFGFELIERMLPYELGARTLIDLSSEGARVELLIPSLCAGATIWRPTSGERKLNPGGPRYE
jgi:hypothetical protein